MFRKTKLTMALGVLATLAAAPGYAQNEHSELGVGGTFFMFDEDWGINNDFGVRGLIGHRFNDQLGLEVVLDKVWAKTEDSDMSLKGTQFHIDGLYHFNTRANWQPYVSVGWGNGTFDVEDISFESTAANVGLGIKWYVTEKFALRPSVNRFFNTEGNGDKVGDKELKMNHTVAGITLSYVWGRGETAKPAPIKMSDADGDGVADAADQCPNTPSGASVDSMGCPIDTDGDGVFDYLDQCPGTGANLKVDDKGCPMSLSETVSIDLKVNFDSNSDVVKPEYFSEIQKVADFMSQYANTQVTIEGHTDTSGAASYNKSLSQKRADAVAQVLISQFNVDSSRVSAIGYGEEKPIADESTREGRMANRRVVAVVSAEVESMQQK
ncbi:OOP family OmpA-OmpF porin [Alteromonadaceae bacterium 2753L.S.0a.02]|nr:OOP family OmpA-OmpF porin [Alteromonadaceae bacterium 2753L.S.0a.02]